MSVPHSLAMSQCQGTLSSQDVRGFINFTVLTTGSHAHTSLPGFQDDSWSAVSRQFGAKNHLALKTSLSPQEQEGSSLQRMASQEIESYLCHYSPHHSSWVEDYALLETQLQIPQVRKDKGCLSQCWWRPGSSRNNCVEARRIICCFWGEGG